MAAVRKLHSQALRIARSHERQYSSMLLREYTRVFNKWRTSARKLFASPRMLELETESILINHEAKLREIFRTNNARVMRSIHSFQMTFLGIKQSDDVYKRTKALIPELSTRLARTAVAQTLSLTTRILNRANILVAEKAEPKEGIDYAFERLRGGMSERRSNHIAGDQAHRSGGVMIQAIGDYIASTGRKVYKMWMSRRDNKVREAHRKADGQTVEANETFTVDGEELRFPGDPNGSPGNVINCRCFTVVKQKPGKRVKRRAA